MYDLIKMKGPNVTKSMDLDKNNTCNLRKSVKFFNHFDAQNLIAYSNKEIQMVYLVSIFHGNYVKILACVP